MNKQDLHEIIDSIESDHYKEINPLIHSKIEKCIEYCKNKMSELSEQTDNSSGEPPMELSINYAILHEYKDMYERLRYSLSVSRFLSHQESYFNPTVNNEDSITPDERDLISKYKNIMDDYFSDLKFINLQAEPPINFYIRVYAKRDCGVVMIDDEFVEIYKNHCYYLKKNDIVHLLNNGSLKILD